MTDQAMDLLAAVERAAMCTGPAEMIKLLAELERLKAVMWQRLLVNAITPAAPPATDVVDELRHLTPHQVGELLNLKPAYIHELCRSRRIAATKTGKYWMIPLTGLHRWLYQKGDVDPGVRERLESMHPRGESAPRPQHRRATSARRPNVHLNEP